MVLLDTGTPGTSREIYSEDANGESRTRNPWITIYFVFILVIKVQLKYNKVVKHRQHLLNL